MTVVYWFRKDLRLQDNQALFEATKVAKDTNIVACFGFNSAWFELLEGIRQHSLVESLKTLDKSLDGNLNVLAAESSQALADNLLKVCQEVNAKLVFAMNCFDPEAVRTQAVVAKTLNASGIELKLIGSAYAVQPGTVAKPDGTNYRVYTPFYKAWRLLADSQPIKIDTSSISFQKSKLAIGIPVANKPTPVKVLAGEAFALRTLERFSKRALDSYDEDRNRADLGGTSHLSHALAHGEIHPRTLLAILGDSPAHEVFRKEIAWREFYADVLHHYPHTLNDYYEPRFKKLRYDTGKQAEQRFKAWQEGKTGYPMVDAGMRQLLSEGWMHNRVRMIVASFLVKDLHLEWTWGAAHFESLLSDFDPASNSHGWQWTAGCGTDASPYYRIFNPILQGLKFDPNGDYVRKYIPELRHLDGALAHEPWTTLEGYSNGYPQQIVDHNTERNESLARLEELKQSS
ncbi:MAG: deoxyribodipyrimidine photo-lyase [Micrococcales bacterium]|nr:deoxyribodipyrimidine photo-lyase [Micrococcales bacterium]NBR60360.1 deoxyribodipyrimidine photo-lyase [Actinomycetota bacterium]